VTDGRHRAEAKKKAEQDYPAPVGVLLPRGAPVERAFDFGQIRHQADWNPQVLGAVSLTRTDMPSSAVYCSAADAIGGAR